MYINGLVHIDNCSGTYYYTVLVHNVFLEQIVGNILNQNMPSLCTKSDNLSDM